MALLLGVLPKPIKRRYSEKCAFGGRQAWNITQLPTLVCDPHDVLKAASRVELSLLSLFHTDLLH
jgi:hypothetical protein